MASQLTRADVYSVFRTIVRSYPVTDCCRGLDTFVEITNENTFASPNLGKTYQDYKDGTFYSKQWVRNGADPDKLDHDYGILGLEQRELTISTACDNSKVVHEWHVVLCDQIECATCKCARSDGKVQADLVNIASHIISELKKYQLYTNHSEPAPDNQYWLTPNHAQYLNNNEDCGDWDLDPADCETDLCCYLVEEKIQITPVDKNFINQGIGVVFSFKTEGCYVPPVDMDYSCDGGKEVDQIARAQCNTCK